MVIKMKFDYGQRIKELREKENVTQKDLAQAIGLNRSSINQFENQYDIKAGRWPENYNECVLVLTSRGNISDFLLYTVLKNGENLKNLLNKN